MMESLLTATTEAKLCGKTGYINKARKIRVQCSVDARKIGGWRWN
jgi:hypothetical protein